MAQYWLEPLPPFRDASAAAVANFTAFQDIAPAAAAWPPFKIPANRLMINTEIVIEAMGQFSTTGTPTLSLGFFVNTAATPFGQTTTITTGSGAAAWPWKLRYRGRVRATGTSGSLYGQANLDLGTSLTAQSTHPGPTSAAARTTTIDTTIERIIGIGASWGTASASNTITVDEFAIWLSGS